MKITSYYVVAVTVLLITAFAIKSPAQSDGRELLVVYSGNTLGELKPCGCAKEEDQGGVERRMTYLKETITADKNTLLVDLGDNFKEPSLQGILKARFLMESMGRMKYDAVTLGDKDMVYGNQFLKDITNIPWVSGNVRVKDLDAPRYRIKNFGNNFKVAILAIADPKLFYGSTHSDSQAQNPLPYLRSTLGDIKREVNPDLVIVLSHMTRESGLKLLDEEGVDIVINGHIESETAVIDMKPVLKGEKIFVQPGPRGQKMGELKVSWDAAGKRVFQQQMVQLDSNFKFDSEMVKLYERYNEKVEELFFASLADRRNKNKARVYAGDKACSTCHAAAHETWSKSRHGKAYQTLKKVNKAFDPECLKCHTVGFNQLGGFISEVDTPELKNVQCEVCHGPALKHTESPKKGFGAGAAEACKQCHVKNHSPQFEFNKYWVRIKH